MKSFTMTLRWNIGEEGELSCLEILNNQGEITTRVYGRDYEELWLHITDVMSDSAHDIYKEGDEEQ
jgi:hypothetical protein